jgi:hypothetical protein
MQIMNALLGAGADPTEKDDQQATLLHYAAGWAALDTVQRVLEVGLVHVLLSVFFSFREVF